MEVPTHLLEGGCSEPMTPVSAWGPERPPGDTGCSSAPTQTLLEVDLNLPLSLSPLPTLSLGLGQRCPGITRLLPHHNPNSNPLGIKGPSLPEITPVLVGILWVDTPAALWALLPRPVD